MHIGFVILIIAAVQNYYYIHFNKLFLPEYLLRLKILPPRSFQFAGGASKHRLFFLHSTKGLTFNVPSVGDIITHSRKIADYPSMYAAIFLIIVLSVLFLNLLDRAEILFLKGNKRGYVSD